LLELAARLAKLSQKNCSHLRVLKSRVWSVTPQQRYTCSMPIASSSNCSRSAHDPDKSWDTLYCCRLKFSAAFHGYSWPRLMSSSMPACKVNFKGTLPSSLRPAQDQASIRLAPSTSITRSTPGLFGGWVVACSQKKCERFLDDEGRLKGVGL
jgi:hypothetical protein